MRTVVRALSSLTFTAALAASAQQQPIVLHNATIVDGTGGNARQHIDITIQKGIIQSVKPASLKPPKAANVVNCTGKTIIPGPA